MPSAVGTSDPTQKGQGAIYVKQGNNESVVDVGGTATMLGINNLNGTNLPSKATFTIAPGSANVTVVTITIVDNGGTACLFPWDFDVILSDSATGAGLTATTASGTVTNGTNGIVISTYTAKKALYVQTAATTGTFDLQITDTGKTGFYIMAQGPGGFPSISRQLVSGDYG